MTLPPPHAIAHLIDDVERLKAAVAAISSRVLGVADVSGLQEALDGIAARTAVLEAIAHAQGLLVVDALAARVTALEAAA